LAAGATFARSAFGNFGCVTVARTEHRAESTEHRELLCSVLLCSTHTEVRQSRGRLLLRRAQTQSHFSLLIAHWRLSLNGPQVFAGQHFGPKEVAICRLLPPKAKEQPAASSQPSQPTCTANADTHRHPLLPVALGAPAACCRLQPFGSFIPPFGSAGWPSKCRAKDHAMGQKAPVQRGVCLPFFWPLFGSSAFPRKGPPELSTQRGAL